MSFHIPFFPPVPDQHFLLGHVVVDCKNPRAIDRSHVADMSADQAWLQIVNAAAVRDMDDVKEGIEQYVKCLPDLTYQDLEKAFRAQDLGVYIIAVEKPVMLGALTNMDLQGNLGKKYQVTYRFSSKAARPREAALWPKDNSENLERLADAGEPVSRGLSKCKNCDQFGHNAINCPEEKAEKDQLRIVCFNCNEEGHRVRDCKSLLVIADVHTLTKLGPTPRIDKFACKNCGKSGHKVAECRYCSIDELVLC